MVYFTVLILLFSLQDSFQVIIVHHVSVFEVHVTIKFIITNLEFSVYYCC